MQTNGTRIAALIGAIALVVILFLVLRGEEGDESTTATPTPAVTQPEPTKSEKPKQTEEDPVPTIIVKGGQPEDGVADLAFDKGDQIRFVVESDTADEVHVHGFDIEQEVEAGGSTEFDFPADIDGIYEVELHGSAIPIAELTVSP